VILTIAIMVSLTIAIAARVLAPRLSEGRVHFARSPDRPAAFGYKMAWLAVRSRDTAAVVEELGLIAPQACNWRSGIGTVYDNRLGNDHIFVSPPVNGWTFVVGLALPYPVGRTFVDKCTPLLDRLGSRFVEVQYFFAYPPVDLFAWARLLEGRVVRAFAITDTGIVWNKGRTTKEERALGLKLFDGCAKLADPGKKRRRRYQAACRSPRTASVTPPAPPDSARTSAVCNDQPAPHFREAAIGARGGE
jgi:hypothetical protein